MRPPGVVTAGENVLRALGIRTRSRLADHRKLIGFGEIQPHSLSDHSGTLAQAKSLPLRFRSPANRHRQWRSNQAIAERLFIEYEQKAVEGVNGPKSGCSSEISVGGTGLEGTR
ncbi:MAG TPA: hypothetical protein VHJ58_20380 [Vicinamibacterales bacterium]|nr:hypothetical protein [Vicinamibacterales bacterium]